MEHGALFIFLACFVGLLMTWGVGANDLANIMSTTMGSKAVTVAQAIAIAIIFEFAGAFLGGDGVSNTLRNGIIIPSALNNNSELLIYGMLSVLIAGTIWMLLASHMGLPVSITNTIVGALVGFGAVLFGTAAIRWKEVSYIAISWIASPTIAGVVAYALFMSMQRLIFDSSEPYHRAKRYAPVYLFLVGLILSVMIVLKGLKHLHIVLSSVAYMALILDTAVVVVIIGMVAIKRMKLSASPDHRTEFIYVEKIFAVLMAFTACAMVFAHGSNDVAIAVGPMTAVVSMVKTKGQMLPDYYFPPSITFLGCFGVILGLLMYGRKVIATVGSGITTLTPSRAFAGTLAAATTVIVSTSIGIPVSATQTLVGAILGVGLARGIGALNMNVIRNIFTSWIITLPVGAGLTIAFFYILKSVL